MYYICVCIITYNTQTHTECYRPRLNKEIVQARRLELSSPEPVENLDRHVDSPMTPAFKGEKMRES